MVGNTISISYCENGVFKRSFNWWGLGKKAQPFFRSSDSNFNRYWAMGQPFKVGSTLYVPLMAVPGLNDLRILRTDVAVINNTDQQPEKWNMTYCLLVITLIMAKKVMKGAELEAFGLLERGWAILYTSMKK